VPWFITVSGYIADEPISMAWVSQLAMNQLSGGPCNTSEAANPNRLARGGRPWDSLRKASNGIFNTEP
jgi:hypothetical protein